MSDFGDWSSLEVTATSCPIELEPCRCVYYTLYCLRTAGIMWKEECKGKQGY